MGSERSDEVPAFNLSPLTFSLNSGSAAKAFFDVLTYLDLISPCLRQKKIVRAVRRDKK